MARREEHDELETTSSYTDPAGVEHTGQLADDGDEQPPESHDNSAHTETYAADGDEQPPETHDNTAHSVTFAEDGDRQPPEEHGNGAHAEEFAVDGDEQPPETHGNLAHSEEFAVDGDEQPPETHNNAAHAETHAVDGDEQPPETHDNAAHSEAYLTAVEAQDDGSTVSATDTIDFGANIDVTDTTGGVQVDANNIENTSKSDTETVSGDGSATSFNLYHSLGTTPVAADVTPTSEDASTDFWISEKTADYVQITYAAAPASGTDNLTNDIITHE